LIKTKKIFQIVFIAAGILLAVMATLWQTNKAKTVFYPNQYNVPKAAWQSGRPVSYQLGSHGRIYYKTWRDAPFMIPGADAGRIPVMDIRNIRLKSDGSLLLVMNKLIPDIPPVLNILVNDRPAARITVTNARDNVVCYVAEVPIHIDPQHRDETNVRIISEGGSWFGGILIVPNLHLRKIVLLALPFASLIAIMCAFNLMERNRKTCLGVIGTVSFLLFYNFLFAARLLPCNPFFADGPELLDAIRNHLFTSDMKRHLLFLPVIKLLTTGFELLTPAILKSYAMAFSLISAVNIVVSILLIERLIPSRRTGCLLSGVYCSSFLIMYYSCIFETYVLSTLVIHSAILATLSLRHKTGVFFQARAAMSTGLIPLASPPLAAFVPMLLLWQSRLSRTSSGTAGRFSQAAPWVLAIATSAVVGLGIAKFYEEKTGKDRKNIMTAISRAHDRYADIDNLTAANLWNVVNDTLVSSLVNVELMRTSSSMTLNRHRISRLLKLATAISVLLLVLGSVMAFLRRRVRLKQYHLAWSAGFLLYVAFHWYFNPGEMLLYATPILLLWLYPAVRLASEGFGTRMTMGVLTVILVCEISAITLASFYSSEALFYDQQGFDIPTIEWRGK